MEDEESQMEEIRGEIPESSDVLPVSPKKSVNPIPLLVTLIGIFCYLGVVLPSVFGSSTRFFDYSIFDLLLMIGGASLVGLGTYFWFVEKTKALLDEEKKSLGAT